MYEPFVEKTNVFVQHVDGTLYSPKQWESEGFDGNSANGIAVITDEASFVISKDEFSSVKWYPTGSYVESVSYISHSNATETDFSKYKDDARKILSGQSDTDLIVSVATQGSAVQCHNYSFPNGKRGYLPAIGELIIVSDYLTEINEALTLIDGTVFSNKYYFSTTQEKINTTKNEYNVFVVYPKSGLITPYTKTQVDWVNTRPFTTL